MQSNTHKTKILLSASVMFVLILSCTKKTKLENQITVNINLIDSKTKEPRINSFDTIIVRKEGFGLIKTFDKVEECITDSAGSVKIKIDRTKEYMFLLGRRNFFGSETFARESLNNGQELNIEVYSIENR